MGDVKAPSSSWGGRPTFCGGALEGWAGRRDNTPHVLSSGISQLAFFGDMIAMGDTAHRGESEIEKVLH